MIARKLRALVAKVHRMLLGASTNFTVFIKLTFFFTTATAVTGSKVIQHRFECRIILKNWVQMSFKTLSVRFKIPQIPQQFHAQSVDIPISKCETLAAVKSTWR